MKYSDTNQVELRKQLTWDAKIYNGMGRHSLTTNIITILNQGYLILREANTTKKSETLKESSIIVQIRFF